MSSLTTYRFSASSVLPFRNLDFTHAGYCSHAEQDFLADSLFLEFVFSLGIHNTVLGSSHGGLCLRGNGNRSDGARVVEMSAFDSMGWL